MIKVKRDANGQLVLPPPKRKGYRHAWTYVCIVQGEVLGKTVAWEILDRPHLPTDDRVTVKECFDAIESARVFRVGV